MATRVTTVSYRYNGKTQEYVPKDMVVQVTEELSKEDAEAAQAEEQEALKEKFLAQEAAKEEKVE